MTAFYNEIDPYAAQWLRNLIAAGHIAPGVVDERSIVDIQPADLEGFDQVHFFAGIGVWSHALRRAGWPDERHVWTGSCPCQPFSSAGKRKGTDDERHLWPHFFRLIQECHPSVVLGEQVASKDGLGWLDAVSADLEGAGYAFRAADLCAAGVGAPHIRQRLWFVGLGNVRGTGTGRDAGADDRPQEEGAGRGQAARGERDGSKLASVSGGVVQPDDERVGLHVLWRGPLQSLLEATGDGEGGSGLANTTSEQPSKVAEILPWPDTEPRGGRSTPPGPVSGYWDPADWVLCRDPGGPRWRPVEPGTFPLAHGAPARVGRLRAYGHAIVAPLAQAWIEAVMESL